jgi:hypothetical protein
MVLWVLRIWKFSEIEKENLNRISSCLEAISAPLVLAINVIIYSLFEINQVVQNTAVSCICGIALETKLLKSIESKPTHNKDWM